MSKMHTQISDELEADIALSRKHLAELCHSGGKRWQMCVPVQSDDHDEVYGRMIRYSQQLLDLLNVFGSLMAIPDDVTMGEVKQTMRDALSANAPKETS